MSFIFKIKKIVTFILLSTFLCMQTNLYALAVQSGTTTEQAMMILKGSIELFKEHSEISQQTPEEAKKQTQELLNTITIPEIYQEENIKFINEGVEYLKKLEDKNITLEIKEEIAKVFFKEDFMNFFPDELKLEVLESLTKEDLGKACQVSKEWQRLAKDNVLWKKKFQRFFSDVMKQRYYSKFDLTQDNWMENVKRLNGFQDIKEIVDEKIKIIKNMEKSEDSRTAAMDYLIDIGLQDIDVINLFINCLDDESPSILLRAAQGLVLLEDVGGDLKEKIIGILIFLLDNQDPNMLISAIDVLSKIEIEDKQLNKEIIQRIFSLTSRLDNDIYAIESMGSMPERESAIEDALIIFGRKNTEMLMEILLCFHQGLLDRPEVHADISKTRILKGIAVDNDKIKILISCLENRELSRAHGTIIETLNLLRVKDESFVQALLESLRQGNHLYIVSETLAFLEIKDEGQKQELVRFAIPLLEHENIYIQMQVARVLINIGIRSDEIKLVLLNILKNDNINTDCREELMTLILELNNKNDDFIFEILDNLKAQNITNTWSCKLLGKVKNKKQKVFSELINMVTNNGFVGSDVVDVLVELGINQEELFPVLVSLLKNEETFVIRHSIKGLVKLGIKKEKVFSELLFLLKHNDFWVGEDALKGLVGLGINKKGLIEALINGLRDKDLAEREKIVRAMDQKDIFLNVENTELVNALIESFKQAEYPLDCFIMRALAKFAKSNKEVLPFMRHFLDTAKDPRIISTTIEEFKKLGESDVDTIASIIKHLHGKDFVSFHALDALVFLEKNKEKLQLDLINSIDSSFGSQRIIDALEKLDLKETRTKEELFVSLGNHLQYAPAIRRLIEKYFENHLAQEKQEISQTQFPTKHSGKDNIESQAESNSNEIITAKVKEITQEEKINISLRNQWTMGENDGTKNIWLDKDTMQTDKLKDVTKSVVVENEAHQIKLKKLYPQSYEKRENLEFDGLYYALKGKDIKVILGDLRNYQSFLMEENKNEKMDNEVWGLIDIIEKIMKNKVLLDSLNQNSSILEQLKNSDDIEMKDFGKEMETRINKLINHAA